MGISNVSSNLRPGVCTSSTRPATPYDGQAIYETDTDRVLVWDGSTWERVVVLDSANRYDFPASATFVSESVTGRGVGIKAGAGDASPATIQFTNNAITAQWATVQSPSDGVINMGATTLQRNGSSFINIVDVPIEVDEWNMAGTTGNRTLSTNIPTTARYIYADVFTTNNSSDHYNIEFSNASCATGIKNWVDVRGQQPSTQFGDMTSRRSVYLTHPGEVDGYTPNYGVWFSGILIPTSGRTLYWGSFGSNGQAWIYLKVLGYSN